MKALTHTHRVNTQRIDNPLTHHTLTDTVSAAQEIILKLQEGYQISLRNKKNVRAEKKSRALGQRRIQKEEDMQQGI